MDPLVAAQVQGLLFDPAQGEFDDAHAEWPLAFIDLDACPADATVSLPPQPVIGVGDPSHPLAAHLDALIERPITAAQLIRQVEEMPRAAAVTTQLLRTIEGMALDAALVVESFAYGILQAGAEHATWLERMRGSMQSLPEPVGAVRMARDGMTLHVTLDRPHARNAIDRHMRDGLFEAFELAAHDSSITSIKLRGVGKAFCVGADLTEFGTTRDPVVAHLIRRRTLPALAVACRAKIVDVHVQGACVGAGLEITAFAAGVTATSNAWFQLPELAMGLLPGAGGCVSVSRRIGRQRAALLMLSGKRIDAATALRWGLIDAIEDEPPLDESGAHVS